MRMSNIKINHLAHQIAGQLLASEAIDYLAEPNAIRLRIKAVLQEEMKLDDEVDTLVRGVLDSLVKKKIHEGSREWEIEYERLYEQEMAKRRRA